MSFGHGGGAPYVTENHKPFRFSFDDIQPEQSGGLGYGASEAADAARHAAMAGRPIEGSTDAAWNGPRKTWQEILDAILHAGSHPGGSGPGGRIYG